jgi:peptide-methionine (R)-S-oxide reductase
LPILIIGLALLSSSCGNAQQSITKSEKKSVNTYPMQLTDAEWKERLTKDQYYILRKKGTEPAGTGKYDKNYQKGTYYSAASLQPVFSSETKFDSGTGWPSFLCTYISPDAIKLVKDASHGMVRWEVVDSKSGSHLGHVFDDGPKANRQAILLNSAASFLYRKVVKRQHLQR